MATLGLPGTGQPVEILQGNLPDTECQGVPGRCAGAVRPPGGPYGGPDGEDWEDNAQRFGLFAGEIVKWLSTAPAWAGAPIWCIAMTGRPAWCRRCWHWKTTAPPHFSPSTILPIRALFSRKDFEILKLPESWWAIDQLEFYGKFSFMKAGLIYADWLTTVSPTYAKRSAHPDYGCGLDGPLARPPQRWPAFSMASTMKSGIQKGSFDATESTARTHRT